MRDRARALNQLQAAEFGNIIINEKKIIVIVAGKFIERAIAIRANLNLGTLLRLTSRPPILRFGGRPQHGE